MQGPRKVILINQSPEEVTGNLREVYRNPGKVILVCTEVIWHFLGSQRGHSAPRGSDLRLHGCHWGPLRSHLEPQGSHSGSLEYHQRPPEDEVGIREVIYGSHHSFEMS